MPNYTTADGATVTTGSRVYNAYDMCPGTVGIDQGDGWFYFYPDSGPSATLDGSRILTITEAARRGFPNAA